MTPIRLNRRHFLGASAAAGLALSHGAAADDLRPVRVGLVGLGNRGTTLLRSTLELPGIEIAAVADPDARALRRAAGICQRAGREAPPTFEHAADLLARSDLHAVIAATPCDQHAGLALNALAAGKHLYMEKPLAPTLAECDAVMKAAADRPELAVHVGFQRRSNPRVRDAVEQLREGVIGKLIGVRGHWISSNGPLTGHGGWLSSRARSGDWMVEQAVHLWDLLNWSLDGPPRAATGHGRRADGPERDVTDWYQVLLRWDAPPLAAGFMHSWVDTPDRDSTGVGLKVVGTLGAVDLHNGQISFRDGRPRPPLQPGPAPDTRLALEAFFHAARAATPPPPPISLAEARDATRVGLLVREAVDAGMNRTVTWDEILSGLEPISPA